MKFRDFIWDFDGTLMDTYYQSTAAFVEIMKKHGIEVDENEAITSLRNSFAFAKEHFAVSDEIFDEFMVRVHVTTAPPLPVLYDGIRGVLEKVIERGGRNFIYSNRNDSCFYYLEESGIKELFSGFVLNGTEGWAVKPSGESVEFIVNKFDLDKSKTAMVGDREIDVLSGKMAGCGTILFEERKREVESCADCIVCNVSEITNYIE